jgi:hypothetical protein
MGTTIRMSVSRAPYPFRLMASKNIFSDGYTQCPDPLSAPVSTSWFDGQAAWPGAEERGIEDTARAVPSAAAGCPGRPAAGDGVAALLPLLLLLLLLLLLDQKGIMRESHEPLGEPGWSPRPGGGLGWVGVVRAWWRRALPDLWSTGQVGGGVELEVSGAVPLAIVATRSEFASILFFLFLFDD